MKRKVLLCPTDFSNAAKTALKTALELAEEESIVEVVHVFQPSPYSTTPITAQGRAEATAALQQIATKNARARAKVRVKLLDGNVAEALIKHAQKIGADVIVMPTYGRKGLARALLGSVTERVVRLSTCPVLTIPI
jgi:nucleotide-binding universal stress UspA family protein